MFFTFLFSVSEDGIKNEKVHFLPSNYRLGLILVIELQKSEIFDHLTIKTIQIWSSGCFDQWFQFFFIYNLVI
jgi:hypothetical protein